MMESNPYSAVKKFDRFRSRGEKGLLYLNIVYLLGFSPLQAFGAFPDCLKRAIVRKQRVLTEEQKLKAALRDANRGQVNWELVDAHHGRLKGEIEAFASQHQVSREIAREEVLSRWVEEVWDAGNLEKRMALAQEWVPQGAEFRKAFREARRVIKSSSGKQKVTVSRRGEILVSDRPLGSGQELIDQIFEIEIKIRESMEGSHQNFKYVAPLKKVILKDKSTGERIRITKVLEAFATEANRQTAVRAEALAELNEALGKRVSPELLKKHGQQDRLQRVLEKAEAMNHALQRRVGAELGRATEKHVSQGLMRTSIEKMEIVAKSRGLDLENLSVSELMKDPVFRAEVQTAAYKLRYFMGPAVFIPTALFVATAQGEAAAVAAIPPAMVADQSLKKELEKLKRDLTTVQDNRKACYRNVVKLKREKSSPTAIVNEEKRCSELIAQANVIYLQIRIYETKGAFDLFEFISEIQ